MELGLALAIAAVAISLFTAGVGIGLFRGKVRDLTRSLDSVALVIADHTREQTSLAEAVRDVVSCTREMRRDHERGMKDHDQAHGTIIGILQRMAEKDAVLAERVAALSA